jgi:hypothetical protein
MRRANVKMLTDNAQKEDGSHTKSEQIVNW